MGQHLPGRRSGRALRSSTATRSSPTTGPAPTPASPSCRRYLEETVDEFGLRPHLRLGHRGRHGHVGRRPPPLDRHPRHRRRGGVPRGHQRGGLPQRPPLLRTGPGLRSSPGRGSTPPGGNTTTTCPTGWWPWWARGRRPPRSSRPSSPGVRKLYVFQREPGWVMPKGERDLTDDRTATPGPTLVAGPAIGRPCGTPSRRACRGGDLPAGDRAERQARGRPVWTTSPGSSPTVPSCSRP